MIRVSFFQNTYSPSLTIPLAPEGKNKIHFPSANPGINEILVRIGSGTWEKKIELVNMGQLPKQNLPCFTPSGVFLFRDDSRLHEYSKLICLDYDKCPSIFEIKKKAKEIESTYACFYSPSLKGVKVLVLVNSFSYQHREAFRQIREYYDTIIGMESDKKCVNPSRLCYVSCDRDLFLNDKATPFQINYPADAEIVGTSTFSEQVQWIIEFTEKKAGTYYPGNQNNFLYRMACNMNRYGFSFEDALQAARSLHDSQPTDFNDRQLVSTIQSGYRNQQEHGKFQIPTA